MDATTSTLKNIRKQLHEGGYKLTPQREATVLVLLENEKDHLSAEEIYMLVKQKSPDIGLATVYRTLEMLTELKIIDKISFNDGLSRYDMRKEGAVVTPKLIDIKHGVTLGVTMAPACCKG